MARIARLPRRGYTLVEILVVLAIILLLIALLIPVLKKARRGAQVLASPIAYVARDGRVHLTDPTGAINLELPRVSAQTCVYCHSPPRWSPSGQTIALSESAGTVIINPMTNDRRLIHSPLGSFLAWKDSSHLVMPDSRFELSIYPVGIPPEIDPRTKRRKRMTPWGTFTPSPRPSSLTAAPTAAPFPYVGTFRVNGVWNVAYARADLSMARPLWKGMTGVTGVQHPVVNPEATYVAWTMRASGTSRLRVAVKPIDEPAWRPPRIMGDRFTQAYFCDWTDQGTLLVNGTENDRDWFLWVFTKDGIPLRKIHTPEAPPIGGVIASWRKYEHR